MLKWIFRAALAAGIGFAGYVGYDYYRGDFINAPDLEDGEFLLSFRSGFKAVMRGIEDERETRRYLGLDAEDVPSWYQEWWSICRTPSAATVSHFERTGGLGPGSRLDGVCEIDADGDVFVRGYVVTVPKLD
ncbi:MAG: hypothetical protein JJ926_01690 [Roseitalea sp.]|jgi:hypothetical protein|nr:hypothetical protein [Roseitalea sp.]MBO6950572.1 hypothetical protein [Rhizobiaceae bacterium]MBO6591441.1 hypothetical protein [Roseitalea sp.]MBO6599296.1 hypothetical protein [Roseitalea sp.]MBO6614056.1 hypothetical protein [Roseitalea sp.]